MIIQSRLETLQDWDFLYSPQTSCNWTKIKVVWQSFQRWRLTSPQNDDYADDRDDNVMMTLDCWQLWILRRAGDREFEVCLGYEMWDVEIGRERYWK